MDEKQVEVIKKVDGPVIRDRRKMGKPLTIPECDNGCADENVQRRADGI